MKFRRMIVGLFVGLFALSSGNVARADLLDYVKKQDKAFSWKLKDKSETPFGTVYLLDMVSQEWQGITWKHEIQIFLPAGVKPTTTMFLWNTGGRPGADSLLLGWDLAKKMNAPVAFLFGIPNQPLFEGKREDALIAETFVRYLNTQDASWPLLFPMVKSLVKAMDAIQEFAKQEWKIDVTHFVVSGASKRGWTTWLTGAADARVKAIAPLVIDTLNMQAQLPNQLRSFGKYSEMIKDYTERGLVPLPKTAEAMKLWAMVDPWVYRDRITMPTLIVNGANDPYWALDALNYYWDDLKCDKRICYVPNAGHNLAQKKDGRTDRTRAISSLVAFARAHIHGQKLPELSWKHDDEGGNARLQVKANVTPKAARIWQTAAQTRDFRKSTWTEQTVDASNGPISFRMPKNGADHRAFFAELEFGEGDARVFLTTQLRILEGTKE